MMLNSEMNSLGPSLLESLYFQVPDASVSHSINSADDLNLCFRAQSVILISGIEYIQNHHE